MKNIARLLTIVALITVLLPSCEKKPAPILIADPDLTSTYTGFSDIPNDYTADDAIKDGCLVIDTEQEPNKYGAMVTKSRQTAGYEHWLAFLASAENGDDAFLRIAHFIDGVGYYRDLYHTDGRYKIYNYDEYGVSGGAPFKYLRKLDGVENGKETSFYVLTDSTKLTFHDVRWKYISSNLETVTDIPFVWLTFMVYFD